MAKDKTTEIVDPEAIPEVPNTPPAGMVNLNDLAGAIGASVAQALASQAPPRKMTFGEYQRRANAGRKKLTREVFQNGFRLGGPGSVDNSLTNEQILLLNQITHTGRYINRLVEVILNVDEAEPVLNIRYNNRSKDQALTLRGHIRNFTDMLQQIVADQIEEDKETEEREGRKREVRERSFGNGKATQEARAKASA